MTDEIAAAEVMRRSPDPVGVSLESKSKSGTQTEGAYYIILVQ